MVLQGIYIEKGLGCCSLNVNSWSDKTKKSLIESRKRWVNQRSIERGIFVAFAINFDCNND
jgi:hypothetical protein